MLRKDQWEKDGLYKMKNIDSILSKYLIESNDVQSYVRTLKNNKVKEFVKDFIKYCTKRGQRPTYKNYGISYSVVKEVIKELEKYGIKEK